MAKVYMTKKHLKTLDVVNKILTRSINKGSLKGEEKKEALEYRNMVRDLLGRHETRLTKDY